MQKLAFCTLLAIRTEADVFVLDAVGTARFVVRFTLCIVSKSTLKERMTNEDY